MQEPRALQPAGYLGKCRVVGIVGHRLHHHSLHEEARLLKRTEVVAQRTMGVVQGHACIVPLQLLGVAHCLEVASARVTPRVDGMQDRKAEATPGVQHTRDLTNNAGYVVHVHQRQRGDRQVDMVVGEWHSHRVDHMHLKGLVCPPRRPCECAGALDANDVMSELFERSRETPLTTTHVESDLPRSWEQRQEHGQVQMPERVIALARASPPHPIPGVLIPRGPQRMLALARSAHSRILTTAKPSRCQTARTLNTMGSVREQTGPVLYEQIGTGYTHARRTEPRIAEQIWSALGDAESVLNVGAGTGSYEPPDRKVLAVEPSRSMRAQRPSGAARCIDASAEALPFSDKSFDAAMAVLSDHHWSDPIAGLLEMRRVARRVVVFQWDDAQDERFWLIRDYLHSECRALRLGAPTLRERAAAIEARMEPVTIPWDVVDGFFHAYWRRPHAYLQEHVRRGSSIWARVGKHAEQRAVAALARDLDSGTWEQRNAKLLELESIDLGARLLIAPAES